LAFFAEDREWQRVIVTKCNEPVIDNDECYRRAFRLLGGGFCQDCRSHEDCVVMFVKTARKLDVLHFAMSGKIDAECHVHHDLLLLGRLKEIDPDRLVYQRMAMSKIGALNTFFSRWMKCYHWRSLGRIAVPRAW